MDKLWACRSSLKIATGFSPFSLIYGIKAVSPIKLAILAPRIVLEEILEDSDDTNAKEKVVDLEGLEERRELARGQSQRYQQKMAKAYEQAIHSRIFT